MSRKHRNLERMRSTRRMWMAQEEQNEGGVKGRDNEGGKEQEHKSGGRGRPGTSRWRRGGAEGVLQEEGKRIMKGRKRMSNRRIRSSGRRCK